MNDSTLFSLYRELGNTKLKKGFLDTCLFLLFILLLIFISFLAWKAIVKNEAVKVGSIEVNQPSIQKASNPITSTQDSQTISKIGQSSKGNQAGRGQAPQQPVVINGGNVNMGTNNGHIGNVTTVTNPTTVVLPAQRKLTDGVKVILTQTIDDSLAARGYTKNFPLDVSSVSDNESRIFGEEILNHLTSLGYNTGSYLGTFQRTPTIKGVYIHYDKNSPKYLRIWVGYPRN